MWASSAGLKQSGLLWIGQFCVAAAILVASFLSMGGAGLGAATWVRGTGAGLPALWAGLGGVRTFFLAATGLPFGAAGFIAFVLGLRPFAAFFPTRAGRRPFPPRPLAFRLGTS